MASLLIALSYDSTETDVYLLFSNSFNIIRVTLNGLHYETLYSKDHYGIIAIDYDYRYKIIIKRVRRIFCVQFSFS